MQGYLTMIGAIGAILTIGGSACADLVNGTLTQEKATAYVAGISAALGVIGLRRAVSRVAVKSGVDPKVA